MGLYFEVKTGVAFNHALGFSIIHNSPLDVLRSLRLHTFARIASLVVRCIFCILVDIDMAWASV